MFLCPVSCLKSTGFFLNVLMIIQSNPKNSSERERKIFKIFRISVQLHDFISSDLKCFSHVQTVSFNIFSLNALSITLVFEISESYSFLHFLYLSFLAEGNLKIPIPFVLREVPQPTAAQLTPGILIQKTRCAEAILRCFICPLFLSRDHY